MLLPSEPDPNAGVKDKSIQSSERKAFLTALVLPPSAKVPSAKPAIATAAGNGTCSFMAKSSAMTSPVDVEDV